MTERTFTTDRRRKTVTGMFFGLGFSVRSIAAELEMAPTKVLAILEDHVVDETACDQLRSLVGPRLLLAGSFDRGAS